MNRLPVLPVQPSPFPIASADSAGRPRVAVLFYRIGPYHFARLKAAGKLFEVTAVEYTNKDLYYAWDPVAGADQFRRVTLFSHVTMESRSSGQILDCIGSALDQLRPAVVAIPGWADRCSIGALRWCVSRRVPAVMMSETTAWDDSRTGWKEVVKRRLVRLCSSALVGGGPHADYLIQCGMPKDRVFCGYDVVDNAHFAAGADAARAEAEALRHRLGLPGNYFLASARFVAKKNLTRLLQAYARYRALAAESVAGAGRLDASWHLVLLGDGPLRNDLCSQLRQLGLSEYVQLPGFKQYQELPAYYGLAGAFIHAGNTEPWGLVVNEAMAAGLPVLVSNRCGCVRDLLQEAENGFSFDPADVEVLAQLMLRLSDSRSDRQAMGRKSRQIIDQFSPDAFASGLSRAVQAALQTAPAPAGLLDRALLSMLSLRKEPEYH